MNSLETGKETVTDTGKANVDVHSSDDANSDSGSVAKHCFPPDGIAVMSRIAYQNTPVHRKNRSGRLCDPPCVRKRDGDFRLRWMLSCR